MKKLKKLLLNIIAFLMITPALTMNLALAELQQGPDSYPDLPYDHWAYEAVTFLTDKKIVVGYPDGLYRPDQKVTRAEFCTMVIKALGLYDKDVPQIFEYNDTKGHWAHRDIQVASYFGLVNGYPGGDFKPNANVTRIEALNVVLNALAPGAMDVEQATHFVSIYQDYSEIPSWALIASGQAQMLGIVYNTPGHENTLEPLRPAMRGELAKFVFNMMEAVKVMPSTKLKAEQDDVRMVKPAEPKKADNGYVLDNVYYDEEYAVIPEGTILPLTINKCMNAKKTNVGETFVARTPYNFVSREKYIVIPVGVQMEGKVHKVERPRRFVRNGYMALTTSNIINSKGDPEMRILATLGEREADMRIIRNDPYLTRTRYNIIRGQNMYIHNGQRVNFVLLEPLRVKIFNNVAVDNDI